MTQARAGAAHDVRDVGLEGRVIDRMHAHRDARADRRGQREFGDQRGVLGLATHRGTVLAVEGDVEHTGTEFGGELGLQRQAFAHARLDAAVVVAHGQDHRTGLGTEQDLTWVNGVRHGLRCATMNRRGKASRRRPSDRAG